MDVQGLIESLGRPGRTAAGGRSAPQQQLKRWWVLERQSPALHAFQQQLLSELSTQVCTLRDRIEETALLTQEGGGEQPHADVKIELLLVETELERAKFVARAYIRTRMAKIARCPHYYLMEGTNLSFAEREYLEGLVALRQELYMASFLSSLPEHLQSLTDNDGLVPMVDKPDLEMPVFLRVRRLPPNNGVLEIQGEPVALEVGGLYVLRYLDAEPLLEYVDIV